MSVSRLGGRTQASWLRRLMVLLGVFVLIGFSSVIASPTASAAPLEPPGQTDHCKLDWNPLKFIVCPVVEGMHVLVRGLDQSINSLMTVNTSPIFNTSTDTGRAYYQVWNSMRLLALGIVIIAALVIIISTAFGLEFLDAYTIKKALPRVLLAIILITLSWPILEFFITLMNDIGNGIRAIIYFPFRESMDAYYIGDGSEYLLSLFFSGSMLLLGFIGLLSLGLTAVLAILVAFLVLVVREMIIIFLVILAPIGIAMLILPNTQKGWQLWQNTLTTLLVAFPIIAAFIAFGRVFSVVAYSTAQDAGGAVRTINEIIAFLAYFIPYFLLPLAFRMAGGVMATIGNIANNSERGMFDRLKKGRQTQIAKNSQALKEGNRFKGRNVVSRGFNTASVGVGTGVKGRFGIGKRGNEAIDLRRRNAAADVTKTPEWNAINQDDDALHAAIRLAGNSRAKTKQRLMAERGMSAEAAERAINTVEATGLKGRSLAIASAQQLSDTGTGYTDMGEQGRMIAEASGGNKSTAASMAGYMNFVNKQRGRFDLAPGAGNLISLAHDNIDGNNVTQQRVDELTVSGSRAGDAVSILRGKSPEVKNFGRTLERHLQNNLKVLQDNQSTTQQKTAASMEVKRTIGQINQLDYNKSFASADNQQVVNELVLSTERERNIADSLFRATPNYEEHMQDIQRFSARGQFATDPDSPIMQRPDSP